MFKKLSTVAIVVSLVLGLGFSAMAGGVGLGYQEEPLLVGELGVIVADVTLDEVVQSGSIVFQPKEMDLGLGMQTEFYRPSTFSRGSFFSIYRVETHDPLDFTELQLNEFNAGVGFRYEGYGVDVKVMGLGAYKTGEVVGETRGLTFVPRGSIIIDFIQVGQGIFDFLDSSE